MIKINYLSERDIKYFRKEGMRILKNKYDGMCDMPTLVQEIKDIIKKHEAVAVYLKDYGEYYKSPAEQVAFCEMYGRAPLRWHPDKEHVIDKISHCANVIVNQLINTDVLSLYGMVVTKSVYDRMVKLVRHMENDRESVKKLPVNWTTNF